MACRLDTPSLFYLFMNIRYRYVIANYLGNSVTTPLSLRMSVN